MVVTYIKIIIITKYSWSLAFILFLFLIHTLKRFFVVGRTEIDGPFVHQTRPSATQDTKRRD